MVGSMPLFSTFHFVHSLHIAVKATSVRVSTQENCPCVVNKISVTCHRLDYFYFVFLPNFVSAVSLAFALFFV